MKNEEIIPMFKMVHEKALKHGSQFFKECDLTLPQCHVIRFLMEKENYEAHFKEIEKGLGVAQSTTAGLVSRLEKKNFVEVTQDISDRRIKNVKLTELAIKTADEIRINMQQVHAILLDNLVMEEKELLVRILKKILKEND